MNKNKQQIEKFDKYKELKHIGTWIGIIIAITYFCMKIGLSWSYIVLIDIITVLTIVVRLQFLALRDKNV